MTRRLEKNARTMIDATAFGVFRPVNQFANPRQGNGRGAHRARLQRHIKVQARQTLGANFRSRRPQHQHFRMGRGVAPSQHPVVIGVPVAGSTNTAPTGTSPRSAAARASDKARCMNGLGLVAMGSSWRAHPCRSSDVSAFIGDLW